MKSFAERRGFRLFMKAEFKPKTRFEVSDINRIVAANPDYIGQCEENYSVRMEAVADAVEGSGCSIVMVSGPSASGKTTSSKKLAIALRARGHQAVVVSLDDFFRNIEDYPKNDKGEPDLEHVGAVDIDCVNETLGRLLTEGCCELPQFDFVAQRRKPETKRLTLEPGGFAIIEGIHALNPLLSERIPQDRIFRLYVGLRNEYYRNGKRVVNTRDLRIIRRMVRDYYFRGYRVEDTLRVWDDMMAGEEIWIKPFKSISNMLMDTSFPYEPCVFRPILEKLAADETEGGSCRETMLRLCGLTAQFEALPVDDVPQSSMLREFLGGLTLPE